MGFGHVSLFLELVEGVLGMLTDMNLMKWKLHIICVQKNSCVFSCFLCNSIPQSDKNIAYSWD